MTDQAIGCLREKEHLEKHASLRVSTKYSSIKKRDRLKKKT